MTRNEFIELLKKEIKPDAQMDFLLYDRLNNDEHILAFLDIRNICMNSDIDDSNNYNRGGIIFKIQKILKEDN